eukprot:scaffold35184_cov24-Attheya_sp.AAC.1
MFSVESEVSYPPSQEAKAKFQPLDPLLVKSIQYADKRCKKICSGALSSSPVLVLQAELRVYLIQGLIKRCKRLQISSASLPSLCAKISATRTIRMDIGSIRPCCQSRKDPVAGAIDVDTAIV